MGRSLYARFGLRSLIYFARWPLLATTCIYFWSFSRTLPPWCNNQSYTRRPRTDWSCRWLTYVVEGGPLINKPFGSRLWEPIGAMHVVHARAQSNHGWSTANSTPSRIRFTRKKLWLLLFGPWTWFVTRWNIWLYRHEGSWPYPYYLFSLQNQCHLVEWHLPRLVDFLKTLLMYLPTSIPWASYSI